MADGQAGPGPDILKTVADFRDKLLAGSIDGVPFLVSKHTHTFGRRVAQFQFVDSDRPANRDLGREQRQWRLDLFVLEPNYFDKRDDLIDVIEKPGDKLLVHPYLGEKRVQTIAGTLTEDESKGGIARISVTCVEAETQSGAAFITLDTSVSRTADFAVTQAQADYARDVPNVSDFRSEFIGAIDNVTSSLRKAKNRIVNALGVIDDLDGAIDDLDDAVASLINTPNELASQLVDLVLGVLSLVGQAIPDRNQPGVEEPRPTAPREELLLQSGNDILGANTAPPTVDTGIAGTERRTTQKTQHDALTALVEAAVAAGVAETAINNITYESSATALRTRNGILDLVRSLEPGSAAAFEALETLASASATRFDAVIAQLPNLSTVNLRLPRPSVVIAYGLYRNSDRANEITHRNGGAARNPLALETHVELEVLDE